MLTRGAAGAINHLLAQASWAREALRPHSGRAARFIVGPVDLCLFVTATGEVAEASEGTAPDLTVRTSPFTALRLGAGDLSVRADVRVEGDEAFARAVWHLATNLRWDAEEDLSRVFGDIVAHRMAASARQGLAAGRDAVERTGLALGEYLTEEGALSPPRQQIAAFTSDVDTARERADRLEARIRALEARLARERGS